MSQASKLTGKVMRHQYFGKVTLDSVVTGSRTLVNVTFIDRGAGWDEIKQRYVGVRTSTGWYRGENRAYLTKDIVHFKSLN